MAPVESITATRLLPYDLYLFLTFPCFSSLSSLPPSTWTRHIANSAQRSQSLCIIIQFTTTHTSPWSSAFSSATASTSSTGNPTPAPTPTPTQAWTATESFLARAYGAATKQFLAGDRVLSRVDVVLQEMRGLGVCVPEGVECVRIEVQQEEGEQEGKGKGVAVDTEEEHRPKQYKDKDDKPTPNQHSPSFPVTALGGTFDHLHAGHKILLTMAASVTTRKIIVGVTDEALLVNKKHHTYLESLPHRIHAVESFLSLIRPTIEHEVVPISDPFGPTAHDPDIQGLVVSEETRSGGSAINTKRLALSPPLNELETLVIELIADDGDAESEEVGATVDVARKMGSTGIRGWLAARDEKEGKREGEGAE